MPRQSQPLPPSMLLRLLLTSALALIVPAETKFLKADLRWPGFRKSHNELQPSLNEILAYREPDGDPIFEKAMRVVDALATQSTCHQAAAGQLLVTCKAVGANMAKEDGKYELLERAKSVYAIRVAVCETGEGKADVPSMCNPILSIPLRLDHEIDVISSRTLAPCLGALMEEHFYWTSYSNNRQDANTLCQATTLESTRLEALQSYQKLAELLPEFRAALGSTRSQWLDFLKKQQEEAQHVYKAQQKYQDEIQAQHKNELGSFHTAMKVAKDGLLDVSESLQRAIATTDSDVIQTREVCGPDNSGDLIADKYQTLRLVLADFVSLQHLLQDAATKTSEKNAEAAAAQAKELTNVHGLAVAATRALENLQTDSLVEDVNMLVQRLKSDLNQIAITQSTQLNNAQHHIQLSEELVAAQEANLALGVRMKDSSTSLASELETARSVAGRVSTRLDKVNQALTRVEAASAILSSLFAIISIPCRMVEQLHFRLLGLFAMPALVLLFWKPRKYSYSLMAAYVFLESLISFVEENRERTIASLRRVGHHSRALSRSGMSISSKYLALAAAASVIICCGYSLSAMWTQSKPKPEPSLTFNALKRLDKCTVGHQYYFDHRLRNGKRSRQLLDRMPRAATVC
ncbi:hypothetical protein H2200_007519 [Cladophialophora chaetospira]|uniref:Nuclear membrane fusion protein Kar5 n=1 Tax=Cladophialophora chaetospira TaxID=386627 RepID=A0AA39CH51_9EURO|nr:hypothetical protein H2200_007519 [Cladophialophora chaetospira]